MSSTLLCIGHPLHGKRAVFTPIWKFVFSFFASFSFSVGPHPSRTLIHHFHSWRYVCVRACMWLCVCSLGLFTKIFILYAIPFFRDAPQSYSTFIFLTMFSFSHLPYRWHPLVAYTRLHCPLSLFLMSFVPSSIFSTKQQKNTEPKKNWKNSLASVICSCAE